MKRLFFLIAGSAFLALIVLIVALTANSIYQLSRYQDHMNRVVETNGRKIDIITRTQVAAHARTDRLLRMAIETDPFVRDALFLDFNRAGFMVGSGRRALIQLGFTSQEKSKFDDQSNHIRRIEAVQEKITDLMSRDKVEEARQVLVAEAIPLQEEFNTMLAGYRETLQRANDEALTQARKDYLHSRRMMIVYGALATILGFALGWLTLDRLAHTTRKIDQQMADLKASYRALEEEATHDPLTGLANRRLFYDRLQHALRQAKRHGKKVGVLFVDMNRFKEVNDIHGHHVGDAVLTEVAARLIKSVRESDTVARVGGDEFVVLLEDLRDRNDCYTAVKKIEESLSRDTNLYGLGLELSASIGQAIYPDDGTNEDQLIHAADAAMYNIKTRLSEARQRSLFNQ
ncbi:MAG: diguanylate cyclase [Hydrogenophilaceae bacterium]|nr:diguanylate cyclase [Hydrogenophilaceae bacterium]